MQPDSVVRKCLDKKEKQDLSSLNYKTLKVMPVRVLYKLFAIIINIVNISKQSISKYENKIEFRAYDVSIKYTHKQFGQKLIYYLGPGMSLNIEKIFFIIPL